MAFGIYHHHNCKLTTHFVDFVEISHFDNDIGSTYQMKKKKKMEAIQQPRKCH